MVALQTLAYSYVRFSSLAQSEGDSLRRQTEAAADWCRRHGVSLDTSTTFRDLGRSAFTGTHRENPDRNSLALFLKMVESGKVPRGSYLLIENLDRLTREHIQPALLLILHLLQAGIKIVQLSPSEVVFDERSDTLPVMMMIVELSRGHSESKMKSERVGKAWQQKKQLARDKGIPMTQVLPAWLALREGKIQIIPERARVVKRIFQLAIDGLGIRGIVAKFTAEGVPPMGSAGHWSKSYVAKILHDRRAIGEHQPTLRKGNRYIPDGDPIPGYYPAVVSEREWLAANDAQRHRKKHRGRIGESVNVFAGLLRDAIDGGTYQATTMETTRGKPRKRFIVNHNGFEGRTEVRKFPFDVFEEEILRHLKEVKPSEIEAPTDKPDEVAVLSAERAEVESKIRRLEEELEESASATVARVLRKLETKLADIDAKLADARRSAATPISEAWPEARTLIDVIKESKNPHETRLQLRGVLRRSIEAIWLVITPLADKRVTACIAQVRFIGTDFARTYAIFHRKPTGNRLSSKSWLPTSFAWPDEEADLRNRLHAEKLASRLREYPTPQFRPCSSPKGERKKRG